MISILIVNYLTNDTFTSYMAVYRFANYLIMFDHVTVEGPGRGVLFDLDLIF